MERNIRMIGKLAVIFCCTVCLIWLIRKDEKVFQLKQPEGDGILLEEVMILLEALSEAEPALPFSEIGRKYENQKDSLLSFEAYGKILEAVGAVLGEEDPLPEEKAAKEKYRPDFYVLKEDWYALYDRLIAKLGLEQRIRKESLDLLCDDTYLLNPAVSEREAPYMVEAGGRAYDYRSSAFLECGFSKVTAYLLDDTLLTPAEKEKGDITLKNVWVMEADERGLSFFYQGYEICYVWQNGKEREKAERELVSDLIFEEGSLKELHKKKERINGRLLRIGDKEVELEGIGVLPVDEEAKAYRLYEELAEVDPREMEIGYDFADFVLEDKKVCGILLMRRENMETIRVALQNSDFSSLYHDRISLVSDTDMEIVYGSYEERQSSLIPAGEILNIEKDSDFLSGDRIQIRPCVQSGSIRIPSLSRSQGEPAYRGTLEIAGEERGLLLINEVLLEEYLYSVVPSEMPASYPQEALKAQAICARTYAYRYLLRPGLPAQGANVDDSVSFQVYNNIAEHMNATRAVKETTGQMLYYENQPVSTYYYSTSCGFGTDAGIWQAENKEAYPYLTSLSISDAETGEGSDGTPELTGEAEFRQYIRNTHETDFESREPWYRWEYEVEKLDAAALGERLIKRFSADQSKVLTYCGEEGEQTTEGLREGVFEEREPGRVKEIYEIFPLERREGGVIDELILCTDAGVFKVISEYNVRYVLNEGGSVVRQDGSEIENGSLLPSAYLVIDTVKEGKNVIGYKIFGGGYGHGVGMSQNGAKEMGERGMESEEIITFFYPGCSVEKLY